MMPLHAVERSSETMASDPRMKRYFHRSLSLAAIGLATSHVVAWGNDNFILQPKIQSSQAATTGAMTQSLNGKPQATASVSVAPASQQLTQTSSLDQPLRSSSVVAQQPSLSSAAANSGPLWVKRGSRSSESTAIRQAIASPQAMASPQPMAFPNESTFAKVEPTSAGSSSRYVPSLGYVPPAGPSPTLATQTLATQTVAAQTVIPQAGQTQTGTSQTGTSQSNHSHSNASPGVAAQLASTEIESGDSTEGKMHLASRLSKSIIGEPAEKKFILSGASSMVGPAAVGQQLSALLANSEQLSRRGLFLSAREEADMAQLRLARFLDSLTNNYRSEPALKAAQTALREAADFSLSRTSEILPELINSHETPVLKSVEIARTPPSTLAQSYYQYAETQLLEAAQQHPWFSDIFYTIGRTYQAEADSTTTADRDLLRAQAIVYYRAAVTIRPSNSLATNQLGFVLLQLDRPKEAQIALVASVDSRLEIPALQNLVEASRRLGDQAMQQWALNAISQLQRQIPPALPNSPEILEVDNNTFRSTAPVVPTSGTPAPLTASSANSGTNSASMAR